MLLWICLSKQTCLLVQNHPSRAFQIMGLLPNLRMATSTGVCVCTVSRRHSSVERLFYFTAQSLRKSQLTQRAAGGLSQSSQTFTSKMIQTACLPRGLKPWVPARWSCLMWWRWLQLWVQAHHLTPQSHLHPAATIPMNTVTKVGLNVLSMCVCIHQTVSATNHLLPTSEAVVSISSSSRQLIWNRLVKHPIGRTVGSP